MPSNVNHWNRLERWLGQNFPEALADLNVGCTESALLFTEEKLGISLPKCLREVYKFHDGQKTTDLSSVGIFYGVSFLPLDQIIYQWSTWVETNEYIDKDGIRDELDEYQISFEPEKVQAVYANNKWIPFAIIAENCYLGLDFDPASRGGIGASMLVVISVFARSSGRTSYQFWSRRRTENGLG
jgi:cell wall assembly regulator SMI1